MTVRVLWLYVGTGRLTGIEYIGVYSLSHLSALSRRREVVRYVQQYGKRLMTDCHGDRE